MKEINITYKFRNQLRRVYKLVGKVNGLSHADLKLSLQRDWSIRTAAAFVNQFGLRYDYSRKKWVQNKVFVKLYKDRAEWKKQLSQESVIDLWNRIDTSI